MPKTREELQGELMALLAAGRELAPDSDADLARVFLDGLAIDGTPHDDDRHWRVSKRSASVAFVGVVWLAAVAILATIPYYYYTHDQDAPGGYFSQAIPTVLAIALALSALVWAANAVRWRLPSVRIIIAPAREDV